MILSISVTSSRRPVHTSSSSASPTSSTPDHRTASVVAMAGHGFGLNGGHPARSHHLAHYNPHVRDELDHDHFVPDWRDCFDFRRIPDFSRTEPDISDRPPDSTWWLLRVAMVVTFCPGAITITMAHPVAAKLPENVRFDCRKTVKQLGSAVARRKSTSSVWRTGLPFWKWVRFYFGNLIFDPFIHGKINNNLSTERLSAFDHVLASSKVTLDWRELI